MFEIIDMAVTNVLTAMVYGVPALVVFAFIHFVLTHPAPQQIQPHLPAPAQEPQIVPTNQEPVFQPIEKQVAPAVNMPESTVTVVECAPVNWSLWKVADLRDKAIRKAFNIKGEQNRRKLKKQALIGRYKAAFAEGCAVDPQALHRDRSIAV